MNAGIAEEIEHRIDLARRRGWKCRLRRVHVEEIAGEIGYWLARGLPDAAAKRIQRAAKVRLGTASPGARLSEAEVAAMLPRGRFVGDCPICTDDPEKPRCVCGDEMSADEMAADDADFARMEAA